MSSQDCIRDLGDGGRPAGRGIAELLRVYMPGTLMPHLRLLFYALLCGLLSGLGGLSLALLLHAIQHIAFTYSPGEIIGSESFLQGVSAATAERRILILCICGLVAGLGWYSLARYGQPLRSVNAAAAPNSAPAKATKRSRPPMNALASATYPPSASVPVVMSVNEEPISCKRTGLSSASPTAVQVTAMGLVPSLRRLTAHANS